MLFSKIVTQKKDFNNCSEYAVNQLTRHFNEWRKEDAGCFIKILWVKDNLVLVTDSIYLIQQWEERERGFVQYLINPQTPQNFAIELAIYELRPVAKMFERIISGVIHRITNLVSRFRSASGNRERHEYLLGGTRMKT